DEVLHVGEFVYQSSYGDEGRVNVDNHVVGNVGGELFQRHAGVVGGFPQRVQVGYDGGQLPEPVPQGGVGGGLIEHPVVGFAEVVEGEPGSIEILGGAPAGPAEVQSLPPL